MRHHLLPALALAALAACTGKSVPPTPDVPPAPAAAPTPPPAAAAPPAVAPVPAVRIELVHDLVCPWCRIGHANLRKALADFQGPVEIHLRPYLLEPDLPPGGADLRERLAAKYGAAQLDAMFARVTAAGAQAGVKFDFAKVRRAPDTSWGHALVAAAPRDKQEALLDALHVAHFEEGADLGDARVLTRVWTSLGLPADQAAAVLADPTARTRIRAEAEAASRQGITGVPHFTFQGPKGEPVAVGGARAPAALRQAMAKVVE